MLETRLHDWDWLAYRAAERHLKHNEHCRQTAAEMLGDLNF